MTRATLQGKAGGGVSRIATRVASRGRRAAQETAPREQRRLQDRCDALEAQLEASEQRRAEILSLISHDLKNPLSPLRMSAQMLCRVIAPDAPGRNSLDIVKRSADELGLALEEVTDAASIDLGRLSVEAKRAPADPREMLTEAIETTRRRAQDRRLEMSVEEGLPPVVCDRHRVVRALVDLVIRALRVTPKGDQVTLRAQRGGEGDTQLSVTDGGPAVPEEVRRTFFDLPSGRGHQRATGQEFALSLFVARGVVEAHGGRIEVESEGERGSTVWLALPGEEPEG